jgi:hypothetical protein
MKPGVDADTLTLFRASRNRKGSSTGIFARCTISAAGFLYCAQDFALLVDTELPVVKAKVDQPRIATTIRFRTVGAAGFVDKPRAPTYPCHSEQASAQRNLFRQTPSDQRRADARRHFLNKTMTAA